MLKKRTILITGLIFIFSTTLSKAFGQQFLWTTVESESDEIKSIPMEDVTKEVLKFYDFYKLYYDQSGYSKERFLKESDFGFKDWTWINDINELTAFALRSNLGQGSIVIVLIISEDNLNMIIFSNNSIEGDLNYQLTYSGIKSKEEKFGEWFKTLLN